MPNQSRILVVEDDPHAMTMLFTALTNDRFSVLTADDGQQAIDLLDRGIRPSLAVIDLQMPRVSGAQLIDYLHADLELRLMPVIVLTGAAKHDVRVVADVVFEKPIDVPVLLKTIRRLTALA